MYLAQDEVEQCHSASCFRVIRNFNNTAILGGRIFCCEFCKEHWLKREGGTLLLKEEK